MASDTQAQKNVVHEMTIWKQLIDTETRTASEWEENWGFLRAKKKLPPPRPTAGDQGANGSGQPILSSAGQTVVHPGGQTADNFSHRLKMLNARATKTPKERFGRPVTTYHEIGWRPTLEKFGVNHHGIRHSEEIWPEL
mmetsp:Transcript_70320/g.131541  ORF Transcript_70320/g.131541 Transcript_70320/m.131541 type:complete len:139 (+) Transcript_70320:22-438(+)